MADTKGNDPKAGPDKPAETKSGAVKPPVIDLTARDSTAAGATSTTLGADKPNAKPATATDTPSAGKGASKPASSVPPTTKPADKTSRDTQAKAGFPWGATLGGGVLGLAAAYGMAAAGLWPSTPAPAPAPDPRVAQFATAIPELETVTQTTQSELAALNQRIAALEEAEPPAPLQPQEAPVAAPAPSVDLAPIQSEIAQLQSRIDALPDQTAPAGEVETLRTEIAGLGTRLDDLAARLDALPDQAAPAGAVETLRSDIAGLATRFDELATRLDGTEQSLATLDTTVAQTSAALAEQPDDINAVLQLPLILSGLETAFGTGRPFQTELQALRGALPDIVPPTTIANAADEGLPRPDVIGRRFDEVLPAIIAAQPANHDAEWQQGALDWVSSAIALRPTGEMEGDTAQAITSRLEGAIARRDWTAANTLFAALPAPMQAAAGDVPAMVAAQADAEQFLQTVRLQTLSSEAPQ